MMEKNRNRASFASNNSMGLSDNGISKSGSGLQMRQSIASVGSDQMNRISQPIGIAMND